MKLSRKIFVLSLGQPASESQYLISLNSQPRATRVYNKQSLLHYLAFLEINLKPENDKYELMRNREVSMSQSIYRKFSFFVHLSESVGGWNLGSLSRSMTIACYA